VLQAPPGRLARPSFRRSTLSTIQKS
jgi:hypothetical protein